MPGDYTCFDGVSGTIAGTGTLSGHYNNSPTTFNFKASETFDYRIDFSDGRYAIGPHSIPIEIRANDSSGITRNAETLPKESRATVYVSDGSVIGTLSRRGASHLTWADLNDDNDLPDPGQIKAGVDHFRLSCP